MIKFGRGALLAFVVLVVAALVAAGGPAQANSRTNQDRRGDAPASADVLRVSASYGHGRMVIKTRIRSLSRSGRLEIYFAPPNQDPDHQYFRYVRVKKTAHRTRAVYINYDYFSGDMTPVRCGVKAGWNRRSDTITVITPRRCQKHNRLELYLSTGPRLRSDFARLRGLHYN